MLTFLPSGLLGLVAASLIAAFMSTISTQLNLGASYLVNDLYQRFLKPDATQQQLVWAGRIFTVISAILGLGLGLLLKDAGQAFSLLLLLGAGTGLIYILRWFWWRINAITEIVAMIASLLIASYFTFFEHTFLPWQTIVIGTALTTLIWVISVYFTRPTEDATLRNFYRKIKPGGNGWDAVIRKAHAEGDMMVKEQGQLPLEILCVVVGCMTVYGVLFAMGNWIYGDLSTAVLLTLISACGAGFLFWVWNRLRAN